MDSSEEIKNVECDTSEQQSLLVENNQLPKNVSLSNDNIDPLKSLDQNTDSENQTSVKTIDCKSQNINIAPEINSVVPTDNSTPSLPPLPKDDKEPHPPAPYSADYNAQNYANYNYMYGNYNSYYGYPYPQYQWDYSSQQYYQPYQNYYNYNYNANQAQTPASKPPPPLPGSVQLPVEEKPAHKINVTTDDDSNRYSPTAGTDDDETLKGLSDNKLDNVIVQPVQTTTIHSTNPVLSEQIETEKNIPEKIENIKNNIQQPIVSLTTSVQQPVLPSTASLQQFNVPIDQPSYVVNPQVKTTEVVSELKKQQQNPPILNGQDDSVEKVSKGSTVLGKSQAKKRLMAFSMMKQKLQEQNSSTNDNQSTDFIEGNDVEFIPELNVFQTVQKKKVVTNKKVTKVIKAQQTIEQIEEMKKDEMMQGNNAALYQHLLRSGGNEAPILQKLGIESLAEKYSAKMREHGKRLKRHQHRHRDDRRGHKYHRHSHSKSRSRSKSTEKPKMRALDVKSWKDFVSGGFHFDKFRRFKLDEAEELKDKERKLRTKKRHSDSRSDGKNQNIESTISTEIEKVNRDQKFRYNLLDRKKEILKGLEVVTYEADGIKDFPSYVIRTTKTKPVVKFSHNPAVATYHLQNRQQMLETLLPEIEKIVHKFLSSIKPKKLKKNATDISFNSIDDKILLMMNNKNVYPFKGWWPKTYFIMTQVKEDPNIEIDKDALINEFPTSKRTKKSRFNDDTISTDLRPTVPSKWDSDYDGNSPVIDKIDVDIPQSIELNTNSSIGIINREKINTLNINYQQEPMDTASDIGEGEPTIEVNVSCPIISTLSHEPQLHTKLNTEYEEFLKIVNVEKTNENINDLSALKGNENSRSTTSVSLNNESMHDESEDDTSTKSSDESVSLHNATEESIDRLSFVKSLSIDRKLTKRKKGSTKKPKKVKKKENKKKKHKSSSSESSEEYESESDSSSEDSESETSDSVSTVEKKKKKKKNKKKKKSKTKKYKSDKIKSKRSEDDKDSNSSILNLLEKAFNVEIKKRPLDNEESKQKKKKRKHEKMDKSTKENEYELEKVKECLKETFTKLVKTDKGHKNQSFSCDDNTAVSEVLKYLKMDEEKEKKKKSKKNSKRKCDSDNSSNEKTFKKVKLDDSLSEDNSEKKKKSKKKKSEKRYVDSDEHVSKKKSKIKIKSSDTSETEDDEGSKNKKSKREKDSNYFFGTRPNEWNKNNRSSMRGVGHHLSVKNKNHTSSINDNIEFDVKGIKTKLNIKHEHLCLSLDKEKNSEAFSSAKTGKTEVELKMLKENIKSIKDSKYDKVGDYHFKNKILQKVDHCDDNVIDHKTVVLQSSLSIKDHNEQQDQSKGHTSVLTLSQSKSPIPDVNDEIVPVKDVVLSYRDKVKMNLKKLSSCQHIPFVFGFTSPLILRKQIHFDEKKEEEKLELNENKEKSEVDKLQHLSPDNRSKIIVSPQTQEKISIVVDTITPKVNLKDNKQDVNQSFNWEDSEDSDFQQPSMTIVNTSNEEVNEKIELCSLKNDLSNNNNNNKNELYKYEETLSDDSNVKETKHTDDSSETSNNSLDSNKKEQEFQFDSDVENNVTEEESISSSNSADLKKSKWCFESSTTEFQNYNEPTEAVSSDIKYSSSLCSQNSNIDFETSKFDNELITQWASDWSDLVDKFVTKINNSPNQRSNECENLQIKKKSRWDKQPNDKISNLHNFNDGQNELEDQTSINTNLLTISENSNHTSNIENEYFEEPNQLCEITSINCLNDNAGYDYYSENWINEYEFYNQYSCTPQYSEMKIIGDGQLSPVDYSIYENYNPNYDYQGEGYDKWNALDTSHELTMISTTEETLSPIQVENAVDVLSSDNISNVEVELSNDKIPIQDVHNDNVQIEKSNSECRKEHFSELYQLYYEHYNQNPIKYSLSDPVVDIKPKINLDVLVKKSPSQQELLDTNQEKEDTAIPIPLQERAYVLLIEDDNTNIYVTSDNYMAYCAIDDRCMVHISIEASSLDGYEDQVRHCFNVNQNGTTVEYWLHADLIPFHNQSDAESGIYSDDEDSSDECGFDVENNVNDSNNEDSDDNNDDMFKGEWEIIDSVVKNVDDWLHDPDVLKKYGEENNIGGVAQTANREECVSYSSECDSYNSDFSDSDSKTLSNKQNIVVNPFQSSFETENDVNETQIIGDVMKQTASSAVINSDSFVEINENSIMAAHVECKNVDELETTENLVSNIKTENIIDDYKNKQDILPKELPIEELVMMNSILNQQMLIQKLKFQSKEKVTEKLPDTVMVSYSDNMDGIKHPFLGLFQPPTISILIKQQKVKIPGVPRLTKRVTFADGINPGVNSQETPMHDDNNRCRSPIPIKQLMRETFKFKHDTYPFKKTKLRRTKIIMEHKKVAKVIPSIKFIKSPDTEYYINQRPLEHLTVTETAIDNNVERSENSSPESDDDNNLLESIKISTSLRPTRDVTPVPSDNECWDDDENINDNK